MIVLCRLTELESWIFFVPLFKIFFVCVNKYVNGEFELFVTSLYKNGMERFFQGLIFKYISWV